MSDPTKALLRDALVWVDECYDSKGTATERDSAAWALRQAISEPPTDPPHQTMDALESQLNTDSLYWSAMELLEYKRYGGDEHYVVRRCDLDALQRVVKGIALKPPQPDALDRELR